MATRAALTELIETNLQSGTSITAVEHRQVEQAIVDSSVPYNVGYFIIPNIAVTTGSLTTYGAASATASIPFANMSKVVVVFNTVMPSADYYVRIFPKSNSNTAQEFYNIFAPYFANASTTGFDLYLREGSSVTNNSFTIYFEAIPV